MGILDISGIGFKSWSAQNETVRSVREVDRGAVDQRDERVTGEGCAIRLYLNRAPHLQGARGGYVWRRLTCGDVEDHIPVVANGEPVAEWSCYLADQSSPAVSDVEQRRCTCILAKRNVLPAINVEPTPSTETDPTEPC